MVNRVSGDLRRLYFELIYEIMGVLAGHPPLMYGSHLSVDIAGISSCMQMLASNAK